VEPGQLTVEVPRARLGRRHRQMLAVGSTTSPGRTGAGAQEPGSGGPGAQDRREARALVTEAMSTDPRFAEPTPFARLPYAHAVGVCGDACITVSLAGSLFFQSPAHAARGKVLLYLLLTMAPFAIIAPILGPALDRMRGGRRILVITSVI